MTTGAPCTYMSTEKIIRRGGGNCDRVEEYLKEQGVSRKDVLKNPEKIAVAQKKATFLLSKETSKMSS